MSTTQTTFDTRLQAVNEADSAQGLLDAVEALAELNDTRAVPTLIQVLGFNRSEERRVGKECRSRWSPYH